MTDRDKTPTLYACTVCGMVAIDVKRKGPQPYEPTPAWPKCARVTRAYGGDSGGGASQEFCRGTMVPIAGSDLGRDANGQ